MFVSSKGQGQDQLPVKLTEIARRSDPATYQFLLCLMYIKISSTAQSVPPNTRECVDHAKILTAYKVALRQLQGLSLGVEAYLKLLEYSRQYIDSKDILDLGTMMLERFPEDVAGYEVIAAERIQMCDLTEAVSVLNIGSDLAQNKLPLLLMLNDVYRKLGQHSDAAFTALRIASLYPSVFDGYARAAQDFLSTHEYSKAIEICEAGLRVLPFNKYLLAKNCIAFRACNMHEAAIAKSSILVSVHPEFSNGHLLLAEDLEKLGQVEKAIEVGQRAVAKFGSFLELRVFTANLLVEAGNYEEAIKSSDQIINTWPSEYDGYELKIKAHLLAEEFLDAIHVAEQGIGATAEQSLPLLLSLSDLHRRLNNRDKAYEVAGRLQQSFPSNDQGFVRSIEDLIELRRFSEARSQAELFRDQFPTSIDILCATISLYRIDGDFTRALVTANLMIGFAREDWRGYYHSAENLASLDRIDEALVIIQEGLDINRDKAELARLQSYILALAKRQVTHIKFPSVAIDSSIQSIIAFSHLPEFNESLYSLQSAAHESLAYTHAKTGHDKSYLFVDGVPRSGTTALGDLLSISEEVELYTELYSFDRIPAYGKYSFERSSLQRALFSNRFDPIAASKDHDTFLRKHDRARFIGDKRPWFHFCLEAAFDNLAPCGFTSIFIWRDIRMLIRSSIIRAKDINDFTWNRDWGGRLMALMCNATARRLLFIKRERPDIYSRILFVQYENIFSELSAALVLFEQVGITLDPSEVDNVKSFIDSSRRLALREFEMDELGCEVVEAVNKYIDKDLLHEFCGECGLSCFI